MMIVGRRFWSSPSTDGEGLSGGEILPYSSLGPKEGTPSPKPSPREDKYKPLGSRWHLNRRTMGGVNPLNG